MLIIYKRNHSSNEWNERIAYCASSSSNIILHLLKKFEGNDFRRREKKAETISKSDFFKKKIQLAARKRPLNFCFSLSRSPLPLRLARHWYSYEFTLLETAELARSERRDFFRKGRFSRCEICRNFPRKHT